MGIVDLLSEYISPTSYLETPYLLSYPNSGVTHGSLRLWFFYETDGRDGTSTKWSTVGPRSGCPGVPRLGRRRRDRGRGVSLGPGRRRTTSRVSDKEGCLSDGRGGGWGGGAQDGHPDTPPRGQTKEDKRFPSVSDRKRNKY